MENNIPAQKSGSLFLAMVWMFIISILLFWLPLIGPLIAGIVGGKQAGSVTSGILAALIPGVIICIILFFAGSAMTAIPYVGIVLAGGGLLLYLFYIPTLLIGALIGGLLN